MRIFQMQRISAIALVIFLTIHMIVVHYPPFHVDFSRIIDRMAQPLWKAIDIAFLFFALMHALTGAYQVLTDVQRFNRFKRILAGWYDDGHGFSTPCIVIVQNHPFSTQPV